MRFTKEANKESNKYNKRLMELTIKIALAIIFGLAALAKFLGKTKDTFQKSGYSLRFMHAVAVAELVLAAGLFTQYDVWAATGLLLVIIGAIVTLVRMQVAYAKYGMAVLSLILLYVLLVLRVYPGIQS
jgi:hypothetical protein